MTLAAKCASDGQVCKMVLEPRHWAGEKVLLISTFQEDPISIEEEFVPLSERGPRLKDESDDMSLVGGGVVSRSIHYENMLCRSSVVRGGTTGRALWLLS